MSYKGNANRNLLNNLMDVVQAKLAEMEPQSTIKKRVFNLLVEILQNIYHHYGHITIDNFSDEESVTFVLAKTQEDYYIIAGNYILNEEMHALKAKIDLINTLPADKLKQVYVNTLGNGIISEKGGAGLGLIEIARKSGGKLLYEFRSCNNHLSFFSLMVKIPAASPAAA
jgi:Mor family transcriptional regulator